MSALLRRNASSAGVGAALAVALLTGCLGPSSGDEAGIYRVTTDGKGLERIAAVEAAPSWSPDGARIAWTAEDGLWTAEADGDGARRLATTRRAAPPSWSPDGSRLAFVDLARQTLEIVPATGGPGTSTSLAVAPAATPAPIPQRDVPAWSPDGRSLAVAAWDGSGDELYRIDLGAGLSVPTRITNTRQSGEPLAAGSPGSPRRAVGNVLSPAWSPHGASIAFALVPQVNDGPSGVYLLDVASGAARRIARGTPLWGPSWSPDGTRLLALLRLDDGVSLVLIDPDTSALDRVDTGETLQPRDGSWSPDGGRIAFSSSGSIYVADIASGTVRLLADTPLDDLAPTWSPDGAWIAFRAEPDRFPQPSLPPIP